MKIAIMQAYLFPYIGYFQLISAVDKFVVYDNLKFTKKGWYNRNRILVNGEAKAFVIPIKKNSDQLNINQRYLSETALNYIKKLLKTIKNYYSKAPQFEACFPLIEGCLMYKNDNLFQYIFNSIEKICAYLSIPTNLLISSKIDIDHSLRHKNKVIQICKHLKGNRYINAIGGVDLYNKAEFQSQGIQLEFLRTETISYKQYYYNFVPNLSMIDVLMFNSISEVNTLLQAYSLF